MFSVVSEELIEISDFLLLVNFCIIWLAGLALLSSECINPGINVFIRTQNTEID